MFITDFDGTLLSDKKNIHQQDLETLARLQAKGIVTVIATGRSLFSFWRALDHMGLPRKRLPVDYLIFSTGAGIYSMARDRVVLSHSLSRADLVDIIRYFDTRHIDYMVQDAIPRTEYFLYKSHGRPNPDFNCRLSLYPDLGQALDDTTRLYTSATEVLAIIPDGIDPQGFEQIQHDLGGFSVILATSPIDHRSAWVEVFAKDVSKSTAARWLTGRLGICQTRVTAVGNDYNDRDLLEWAGRGFLMENAPGEMKGLFETAGSNNRCGVTRAAALPA